MTRILTGDFDFDDPDRYDYDDPLDDDAVERCPVCGEALPFDTEACVAGCGWHAEGAA